MITALTSVSLFLILAVFITKVNNNYWIFKILEYPRLQKLFLILFVVVLWFFFLPLDLWYTQISFFGLCASAAYIIYKIVPYTFLAPKEMAHTRQRNEKDELKIYAANVLQNNTDYQRLLRQIESCNPDIVFLLETNIAWANAMQSLKNEYHHYLEQPLENTYGLLFYSKHKLERASICYLVKNDIPSVEAVLQLPSGTKVQLWGLHPEPPVPGESLYSTAKDKELMKIALKAKECKLPCIVFGDLNDVAWSHTTELFRKTSELLDPRRGRGFFNTFSAYNWFMRFPLDYIFCSTHFALINMKRLPKNGSDHFAILVHLLYQPSLEKAHNQPRADEDEAKDAKEIASQKGKT